MGFRASPEREKLMEELISSGSLQAPEQVLLLDGIIKQTASQEKRNEAAQKMLRMLETSKSPTIKNDVLIRLAESYPDFPLLPKTFEEILKDPSAFELHPLAIRQLSSYRSEWLKENFANVATSDDVPIRLAAFNVIASLCPENRWELLENSLFQEKDRRVKAALLRALKQLGGQPMQILLNKALESKVFDTDENQSFQELLGDPAVNTQKSDTCTLQKQT
jgi:hypothetical protein